MPPVKPSRSLTAGKSREDLDAERLLQLGLTQLLEVIGEAASRVTRKPANASQEFLAARGRHEGLIHGYDTVDLDVDEEYESLPPFILALEKALQELMMLGGKSTFAADTR